MLRYFETFTKEFIQVCALGAKGSKRKEYRIAATEEAIEEWARPLGSRDQVVLVPRVSQSAGRCHGGRITKAGPILVRSLVVEPAQILARSPSPLATSYWRVRRKRGQNAAVTAPARKLVVVAWHLLQKREPYRYAPVPGTRRKLRALIPRQQRRAATASPETLEQVYREADLPSPSRAERRAAAANRRARTRMANASPKA